MSHTKIKLTMLGKYTAKLSSLVGEDGHGGLDGLDGKVLDSVEAHLKGPLGIVFLFFNNQ